MPPETASEAHALGIPSGSNFRRKSCSRLTVSVPNETCSSSSSSSSRLSPTCSLSSSFSTVFSTCSSFPSSSSYNCSSSSCLSSPRLVSGHSRRLSPTLSVDCRQVLAQCRFVGYFFYLLCSLLLLSERAHAYDNSRVSFIVEKFPDDLLWEYHLRSPRVAEVSRISWKEYTEFKEQNCLGDLTEMDDEEKAVDYLKWEEASFHRSLRFRLLPGKDPSEPLSLEETVFLSKLEGRLLVPLEESKCQENAALDSDQNEHSDRDTFEDRLLGRLFEDEMQAVDAARM